VTEIFGAVARGSWRVLAALVDSGAEAAGALALRLASEGLAALADSVDGRHHVLRALGIAVDVRDVEVAGKLLALAQRSWPDDPDVAYYAAVMRLWPWPERASSGTADRGDWR